MKSFPLIIAVLKRIVSVGATLVHEFHIFFSHAEWNLISFFLGEKTKCSEN